jgi:hypothetical protein
MRYQSVLDLSSSGLSRRGQRLSSGMATTSAAKTTLELRKEQLSGNSTDSQPYKSSQNAKKLFIPNFDSALSSSQLAIPEKRKATSTTFEGKLRRSGYSSSVSDMRSMTGDAAGSGKPKGIRERVVGR